MLYIYKRCKKKKKNKQGLFKEHRMKDYKYITV